MSAEAVAIPLDAGWLTSEHPIIARAADSGYKEVADKYGYDPKTVHLKVICSYITEILDLSLRQEGYKFWPFSRELKRCQMPHMYLRSAETGRGLIVVDAAWQQWVPWHKRDPSFPKVAVGTPDEVVSLAEDAGVRSKYLDFWRYEASTKVVAEIDERFLFGFYDQAN